MKNNMRKMNNRATLLLALSLLSAAGAQAQTPIMAPVAKDYVISSVADATAAGTAPEYLWYRNNTPIPGATAASYTVPAAEAFGSNVEFKRRALTGNCTGPNQGYSNVVVVSFVGDCGLLVGKVCWSSVNVDGLNSFASLPDMPTTYFQWNRQTAYTSSGTVPSPEWDISLNTSNSWQFNPCPIGWRLPTSSEANALINMGSTWAAANSAKGNNAAGNFFGPKNTTCKMPGTANDDMMGCIFIPASGYRAVAAGAPNSVNGTGYYWLTIVYDANRAYYLEVKSTPAVNYTLANNRAAGFTIRCVQTVE